MGSSFYLSQVGGNAVGYLIMLALFAHKAPEAAGFGTFIAHLKTGRCLLASYILAYAFSSPLTGFITFAVFNGQKNAIVEDERGIEQLNWWIGFTLLVAVGTMMHITLMHILPEIMECQDGHECDFDRFCANS